MNYLALARRAQRESGRGGTGPASVATATGPELDLCYWVADEWRNLQLARRNWKWMRQQALGDLAVGDLSYPPAVVGAAAWERWAVPNDLYKPSVYQLSNPQTEWSLGWMPYEQFALQFLRGTPANGAPYYWSIAPTGDVLIGPAPDVAGYKLRIDYYTVPTELVNDTDIPGMPEHFHMIVAWRAAAQAALADNAQEVYQRCSMNAATLFGPLIDSQGEPISFSIRPLA